MQAALCATDSLARTAKSALTCPLVLHPIGDFVHAVRHAPSRLRAACAVRSMNASVIASETRPTVALDQIADLVCARQRRYHHVSMSFNMAAGRRVFFTRMRWTVSLNRPASTYFTNGMRKASP